MTDKQIYKSAVRLIKEVGNFQLTHWRNMETEDIQFKGKNDLVSFVDLQSEERLKNELLALTPNAQFIAEESSQDVRDLSNTWIIDPLDGTTNFLHGVPAFCISVAYYRDDEALMGFIYDPVHDEFFSANPEGAYLNSSPINTSKTNTLNDALVATGFPYSLIGELPLYLQILQEIMSQTRAMRRLGSAALDLAYVACGRFDLFYEFGLSPWDVAAGKLIVEKAGGKVSAISANNNSLFDHEILASNHFIFENAFEIISQKLTKNL